GNYNPGATDAFQEAVVLPPVRLVREGEMNQDIVDILLRNTRLPQSAMGDLNGQLGALDLGVKRLDALIDDYGTATVRAALDALGDRAEALMRAELSALPDGRWEAEDFLDNDGITDVPLSIRVGLEIVGDRLILDFEDTAPVTAGPVNIALPTAVATAYVAIKHIFPSLPANAGVMRCIDVRVPEGSLLSAEFPAPVGGYTETILRMIDVIFAAMAKAAPERTVANAYGTINALSLSGRRGETGQRWVMFSFFGGGHGASAEGDGLNHGNAPISTATMPPMEILEAAYPVLFRQWALRPDSAGHGRHRGGLGAVYEIELLEERAEAFLFGERARFAPRGIAGGGEAAANAFAYEDAEGWQQPALASKARGIALSRGQRLRLETPGGGGYGPAAARSPAAVARDVALGYLAPDAADRAYGQDWRETQGEAGE
ncbi:MAG: hydantoinase B/oxoprolinase family protein, partial [Pseudomonadota bacterium]